MENKPLYPVTGLSAENPATENCRVLQNAVYCAIREGCGGIRLEAGVYPISNEKAYTLYEQLLTGKKRPNSSYSFQEPNPLVELSGINGFIIDGGGATWLLDGLMAPFELRDSANVTLRNLTVDFQRPTFFTAQVLEVNGKTVTIQPHRDTLCGGEPIVSLQGVDMLTGKPDGFAVFEGISDIALNGDGTASFTCEEAADISVGQSLVLRHIYSFAPGIHLLRCQNIWIENITLRCVHGMGLIAQKTENITIRRSAIRPTAGRVMSVNCDGLHFIHCRGKIRVEECCFEGMGDDALNVHGFYLLIKEICGQRLYWYQPAESQDAVPYIPEKGDRVEFVKADTMQAVGECLLTEVGFDRERNQYYVELDAPVPVGTTLGDCFTDLTETASVDYKNCTVQNIRGRGALIKTSDAQIRNCRFIGCSGAAVMVAVGAAPWYESMAASRVCVENCMATGCGYAPEKYCQCSGIHIYAAGGCTWPVHRDIVIRNNIIDGKRTALHIANAKSVWLADNCLADNDELYAAYCEDLHIRL